MTSIAFINVRSSINTLFCYHNQDCNVCMCVLLFFDMHLLIFVSLWTGLLCLVRKGKGSLHWTWMEPWAVLLGPPSRWREYQTNSSKSYRLKKTPTWRILVSPWDIIYYVFFIIYMCGETCYLMLVVVLWNETFLFPVKESGEDNRNICDDGRSQKLSPEEISQLKDSGLTGKEVGSFMCRMITV